MWSLWEGGTGIHTKHKMNTENEIYVATMKLNNVLVKVIGGGKGKGWSVGG